MRTTLESLAETSGAEWALEWVSVGRGECECGEWLPLGQRDGVRLCIECLTDGTAHEYATDDEIAQRLAHTDEFGHVVTASPSEVRAFRKGVADTIGEVVTWLVDLDGIVIVKCSAVPDKTVNGFAVPIFNRAQLIDALEACEAQGWVRHETGTDGSPWDGWRESECGCPVVQDLGQDSYILGEGWIWAVVEADEPTA